MMEDNKVEVYDVRPIYQRRNGEWVMIGELYGTIYHAKADGERFTSKYLNRCKDWMEQKIADGAKQAEIIQEDVEKQEFQVMEMYEDRSPQYHKEESIARTAAELSGRAGRTD